LEEEMKEYRLKVFEKRGLKRIFKAKGGGGGLKTE
jgi:hypothetical protein